VIRQGFRRLAFARECTIAEQDCATKAVFAYLAGVLRPGGRLHFVCPQDPLNSEWVAVAFGAAVKATGRAPEVGQPGETGPFAFADGVRLGRLLTSSGFQEPRLESIVRPVRLGPDTDVNPSLGLFPIRGALLQVSTGHTGGQEAGSAAA
jgi:hypothetical protein